MTLGAPWVLKLRGPAKHHHHDHHHSLVSFLSCISDFGSFGFRIWGKLTNKIKGSRDVSGDVSEDVWGPLGSWIGAQPLGKEVFAASSRVWAWTSLLRICQSCQSEKPCYRVPSLSVQFLGMWIDVNSKTYKATRSQGSTRQSRGWRTERPESSWDFAVRSVRFTLNSLLDDLSRDAWPPGGHDRRPFRCELPCSATMQWISMFHRIPSIFAQLDLLVFPCFFLWTWTLRLLAFILQRRWCCFFRLSPGVQVLHWVWLWAWWKPLALRVASGGPKHQCSIDNTNIQM